MEVVGTRLIHKCGRHRCQLNDDVIHHLTEIAEFKYRYLVPSIVDCRRESEICK
jgi:hypothetical protein